MNGGGQGFLHGGGLEGATFLTCAEIGIGGGVEGANFLTNTEKGTGGGVEGVLFNVTMEVGIRGGGGGREGSGGGSAIWGQFFTFAILGRNNNKNF